MKGIVIYETETMGFAKHVTYGTEYEGHTRDDIIRAALADNFIKKSSDEIKTNARIVKATAYTIIRGRREEICEGDIERCSK